MATPEELRAMDLKLKGANDECLAYGQWNRIRDIHILAKANSYQTDFPVDNGDWWRYAKPSAATAAQLATPRCNLPVAIARLSANIPTGGAYNSDRFINEDGFVIKKKMAV